MSIPQRQQDQDPAKAGGDGSVEEHPLEGGQTEAVDEAQEDEAADEKHGRAEPIAASPEREQHGGHSEGPGLSGEHHETGTGPEIPEAP